MVDFFCFLVFGFEELGEESDGHFVDVFVDFFVVVFLFESEQVEEVVPLALLFDVVDVVVDQVDEIVVVESQPFVPLAVDNVPYLHLLLLRVLQHLDLVVQILNRREGPPAHVSPSADLAVALLLHLYTQSLLPLPDLHPSNQVDRQVAPSFDGLDGADEPEPVEVDATAVGSAFVLEIKHLFPNPIPIVFDGFVNALFLENAPLHLVEQLLFGERTRLPLKLLVVILALGQAGMALAG